MNRVPGRFTFTGTWSACEIERLFILILLSGCLAFLLMWSAPSNQSSIADYERSMKDKLDNITAKRHRLQKFVDDFKFIKPDDELHANPEHLKVDEDLHEPLSSSVEENNKVMKRVIEKVPDEKKFKHKITINVPSGGRLGNLMFSYASMYGIAMENFMIPSLDYDSVLFKYFNITAKYIEANEKMGNWAVYTEVAPNIYIDHETDRLNYEIDIYLYGFFQSWKYFRNVEQEIRKQFAFSSSIQNTANSFLLEALEKFHISNKSFKSHSFRTVFVGIHVRRGDMLDWENFEHGYTVAPFSYLDFALAYFEAKYKHLIFVVCSDDMKWSRKYLENRNTTVVFSKGHEAVEDLAILSYCNHSVITVGTFGWWAAWLTGGTTIYYRKFPQKFSDLSEVFSSKDYYPPHWIGLE